MRLIWAFILVYCLLAGLVKGQNGKDMFYKNDRCLMNCKGNGKCKTFKEQAADFNELKNNCKLCISTKCNDVERGNCARYAQEECSRSGVCPSWFDSSERSSACHSCETWCFEAFGNTPRDAERVADLVVYMLGSDGVSGVVPQLADILNVKTSSLLIIVKQVLNSMFEIKNTTEDEGESGRHAILLYKQLEILFGKNKGASEREIIDRLIDIADKAIPFPLPAVKRGDYGMLYRSTAKCLENCEISDNCLTSSQLKRLWSTASDTCQQCIEQSCPGNINGVCFFDVIRGCAAKEECRLNRKQKMRFARCDLCRRNCYSENYKDENLYTIRRHDMVDEIIARLPETLRSLIAKEYSVTDSRVKRVIAVATSVGRCIGNILNEPLLCSVKCGPSEACRRDCRIKGMRASVDQLNLDLAIFAGPDYDDQRDWEKLNEFIILMFGKPGETGIAGRVLTTFSQLLNASEWSSYDQFDWLANPLKSVLSQTLSFLEPFKKDGSLSFFRSMLFNQESRFALEDWDNMFTLIKILFGEPGENGIVYNMLQSNLIPNTLNVGTGEIIQDLLGKSGLGDSIQAVLGFLMQQNVQQDKQYKPIDHQKLFGKYYSKQANWNRLFKFLTTLFGQLSPYGVAGRLYEMKSELITEFSAEKTVKNINEITRFVIGKTGTGGLNRFLKAGKPVTDEDWSNFFLFLEYLFGESGQDGWVGKIIKYDLRDSGGDIINVTEKLTRIFVGKPGDTTIFSSFQGPGISNSLGWKNLFTILKVFFGKGSSDGLVGKFVKEGITIPVEPFLNQMQSLMNLLFGKIGSNNGGLISVFVDLEINEEKDIKRNNRMYRLLTMFFGEAGDEGIFWRMRRLPMPDDFIKNIEKLLKVNIGKADKKTVLGGLVKLGYSLNEQNWENFFEMMKILFGDLGKEGLTGKLTGLNMPDAISTTEQLLVMLFGDSETQGYLDANVRSYLTGYTSQEDWENFIKLLKYLFGEPGENGIVGMISKYNLEFSADFIQEIKQIVTLTIGKPGSSNVFTRFKVNDFSNSKNYEWLFEHLKYFFGSVGNNGLVGKFIQAGIKLPDDFTKNINDMMVMMFGEEGKGGFLTSFINPQVTASFTKQSRQRLRTLNEMIFGEPGVEGIFFKLMKTNIALPAGLPGITFTKEVTKRLFGDSGSGGLFGSFLQAIGTKKQSMIIQDLGWIRLFELMNYLFGNTGKEGILGQVMSITKLPSKDSLQDTYQDMLKFLDIMLGKDGKGGVIGGILKQSSEIFGTQVQVQSSLVDIGGRSKDWNNFLAMMTQFFGPANKNGIVENLLKINVERGQTTTLKDLNDFLKLTLGQTGSEGLFGRLFKDNGMFRMIQKLQQRNPSNSSSVLLGGSSLRITKFSDLSDWRKFFKFMEILFGKPGKNGIIGRLLDQDFGVSDNLNETFNVLFGESGKEGVLGILFTFTEQLSSYPGLEEAARLTPGISVNKGWKKLFQFLKLLFGNPGPDGVIGTLNELSKKSDLVSLDGDTNLSILTKSMKIMFGKSGKGGLFGKLLSKSGPLSFVLELSAKTIDSQVTPSQCLSSCQSKGLCSSVKFPPQPYYVFPTYCVRCLKYKCSQNIFDDECIAKAFTSCDSVCPRLTTQDRKILDQCAGCKQECQDSKGGQGISVSEQWDKLFKFLEFLFGKAGKRGIIVRLVQGKPSIGKLAGLYQRSARDPDAWKEIYQDISKCLESCEKGGQCLAEKKRKKWYKLQDKTCRDCVRSVCDLTTIEDGCIEKTFPKCQASSLCEVNPAQQERFEACTQCRARCLPESGSGQELGDEPDLLKKIVLQSVEEALKPLFGETGQGGVLGPLLTAIHKSITVPGGTMQVFRPGSVTEKSVDQMFKFLELLFGKASEDNGIIRTYIEDGSSRTLYPLIFGFDAIGTTARYKRTSGCIRSCRYGHCSREAISPFWEMWSDKCKRCIKSTCNGPSDTDCLYSDHQRCVEEKLCKKMPDQQFYQLKSCAICVKSCYSAQPTVDQRTSLESKFSSMVDKVFGTTGSGGIIGNLLQGSYVPSKPGSNLNRLNTDEILKQMPLPCQSCVTAKCRDSDKEFNCIVEAYSNCGNICPKLTGSGRLMQLLRMRQN